MSCMAHRDECCGEGGEGLNLVFCIDALALEPIHVAAHSGGKRFLKLEQVSGRDTRGKLFLEFGRAH